MFDPDEVNRLYGWPGAVGYVEPTVARLINAAMKERTMTKPRKSAAPKRRPLYEVAREINAFLAKFENDPKINAADPKYKVRPYYYARAFSVTGRLVRIKYVSYQVEYKLKRDEAEAYLAWLKAGNVGPHYAMSR